MRKNNSFVLAILLLIFVAHASAQSLMELQDGWRMSSADNIKDDAAVSRADFDDSTWYPIHRMPATVLEGYLYLGLNTEPDRVPWRALFISK